MILTRDVSFSFSAAVFFRALWNTRASKQAQGIGQGGFPAAATSLINKLVVLHVDVTGADLRMKLWSCFSPVGAAGI